jgi:hypothetical protein
MLHQTAFILQSRRMGLIRGKDVKRGERAPTSVIGANSKCNCFDLTAMNALRVGAEAGGRVEDGRRADAREYTTINCRARRGAGGRSTADRNAFITIEHSPIRDAFSARSVKSNSNFKRVRIE